MFELKELFYLKKNLTDVETFLFFPLSFSFSFFVFDFVLDIFMASLLLFRICRYGIFVPLVLIKVGTNLVPILVKVD